MTRVEGEGGIEIDLDEQRRLVDARVTIFEPPRFFEGIVRGHRCEEIADIIARICGLCPITYQLGTLMALERILGVAVSSQVRLLRKVFILSQYLGSHCLHVFFLALPDYLGCDNLFEMVGAHRDLVNRGLRLKKIGNDIASFLGAREIHPVTAVIGGFTKLPPRSMLEDLIVQLRARLDDALAALEQIAALRRPAWVGGRIYGALSHPEEYALDEGMWRTSDGLYLPADEFPGCVEEYQAPYSNALRCRLINGAYYMVGPLARVNLNFEQLAPETRRAADRLQLGPPDYNPFNSIVARAIEIMHAVEASIAYLEELVALEKQVPTGEVSSSGELSSGNSPASKEAPSAPPSNRAPSIRRMGARSGGRPLRPALNGEQDNLAPAAPSGRNSGSRRDEAVEYRAPASNLELSPAYDFRAGAAASLIEAPRGTLYHRFRLDERGLVREARIIPPTTQNLSRAEQDLKELVPQVSHLSDADLTRACEVAVRNYDPCISCATHCVITRG
jgi:coenzyme F420-reducing hydrogenase alpha subunit